MKIIWLFAALSALCLAPPVQADEAAKGKSQSFDVPYRLTIPKHVLVRAKINGKGPFNFILDTGAPALFVATAVAKKLGVEPDGKGWGVFNRFEIEGGVVLEQAKGRIETPFQLEGMNGMGLAGAEVHGMIGYNIIARYRIEFDFTRDKMTWTPLDYKPRDPLGLGGKGSSGGGLEVMGSLMKVLGGFLGKKANPDVILRGFLGMELEDGMTAPVVRSVLATGPAGKAGLKAGDQLTHFQGRSVQNTEDVHRFAKKLSAGTEITLTVIRGKDTKEIHCTTGEGL
jgi:hypothetical protein